MKKYEIIKSDICPDFLLVRLLLDVDTGWNGTGYFYRYYNLSSGITQVANAMTDIEVVKQ